MTATDSWWSPSATAARRPRRTHPFLALLAAFAPLAAHALPQGASVQAGQAKVSTPTASSMVVDQGTARVILDWRSFSIGAGQSVLFRQPDASSVALNRVTGGQPSAIFGALSANGQVFLVNPAGVLFAPGAQVNVGGLVAATLALGDADFLAGRYRFGGSGAGVVNQGAIRGGYVALAGGQVTNEGTITAAGGAVALLAGTRVTVDPSGTGLVTFSVDAGALDAAIRQAGTIVADGGRVLLSAQALSQAYPSVINQSGVIRADSIAERNGTIDLSAGRDGAVLNAGTLSAQGLQPGERGGTVRILGDRVGVLAGARVDAGGDSGGGTVLVGGNFQGRGPEQNAARTEVDAGAWLAADARTRGDGGKVVVWSDQVTRHAGAISARGGAAGGDGGSAEVSGKQQLHFAGQADLEAPRGKLGTLLLDPAMIRVVAGGTDRPNASGLARIDPASLDALRASVELRAAGDIYVESPVSLRTPGADFQAMAGNAIIVQGNAGITTNGGMIFLNANTTMGGGPASGTGFVLVGGPLNANAGAIYIDNFGSPTANRIGTTVTGSNISITGRVRLTGDTRLWAQGGSIYADGFDGQGHALTVWARGLTFTGGVTNAVVKSSDPVAQGGGEIRIDGTVTGAGDVSVQADDRVTFGSTVSAHDLDVHAGHGLMLGGDLTATGHLHLYDDVSVAAGVRQLNLQAGSTLAIDAGLAGQPALDLTLRAGNDLTVNASRLGPVHVLRVESAHGDIHFDHSQSANGGLGVLATAGVVVDAPEGDVGGDSQPLVVHPGTPSVSGRAHALWSVSSRPLLRSLEAAREAEVEDAAHGNAANDEAATRRSGRATTTVLGTGIRLPACAQEQRGGQACAR